MGRGKEAEAKGVCVWATVSGTRIDSASQ